jgi:hypothetical protein
MKVSLTVFQRYLQILERRANNGDNKDLKPTKIREKYQNPRGRRKTGTGNGERKGREGRRKGGEGTGSRTGTREEEGKQGNTKNQEGTKNREQNMGQSQPKPTKPT